MPICEVVGLGLRCAALIFRSVRGMKGIPEDTITIAIVVSSSKA